MFRKAISGILALALISALAFGQSHGSQSHRVDVHGGQGIKLTTLASVSSASAKKGDDVPLRVAEPLIWNSVILLPAGEIVHARISKVKPARRDCSDGGISLELNHLTLQHSSRVRTKLAFVDPDPDRKVPAQLPHDHVNPLVWTLLGPFAVVAAPLIVPYEAGESIVRHCSGLGNDYVLPAGATVAIAITEDYTIKY